MTTKNIDWNKYVEESNEAFNKATKAEKRVMLARDVLARLKAGNLKAKTGKILQSTGFKGVDKPFKEVINNIKECKVCAKGGLLCSYIVRVNKLSANDVYCGINNDIYDLVHKKLKELFSAVQLDMMEIAFENVSYLDQCSYNKEIACRTFCVENNGSMEAIMENIINNKGTFKP